MPTGVYLGSLHLSDPKIGTPAAAAGYRVEMAAEGTDWGNPESTEIAIQSLLQDGDLVEHTRDGNRAQTLRLILTGTAAQLQLGEAALMAELYKRNTLTVPPLLAGGATSVFDVIMSSLEQIPDDLAEVQANQWHYSVRLVCHPHPRPATKTTVTALPAVGTTTTSIDNGSATTGWTGSHTVTSSGGMVRSTSGATDANQTLWLTRTIAAVDLSTQRYVTVDWSCPWRDVSVPATLLVDGVAQEKVGEVVLPSGLIRSQFLSADASATTFQFSCAAQHGVASAALELAIDQLSKTDVPPTQSSTNRQGMRYFTVGGSARTEGELNLYHASSALNHALIYTRTPDGSPYTPPLRQFRSSAGATTADAATISGTYENSISTTAFTATIPKLAVPDGTYILIAALKASGAGTTTLTMSAETKVSTFSLRNVASWTQDLTLSTSWEPFQLGPRFTLPQAGLSQESNASIVITIADAVGGITVNLDEAWLFNLDSGDLTWVNCFAAGFIGGYPAATRLWVLPPDVNTPYQRILRGTAADLSDSFAAEPISLGAHSLEPGEASAFIVTQGAQSPTLDVSYFKRYKHHVGA